MDRKHTHHPGRETEPGATALVGRTFSERVCGSGAQVGPGTLARVVWPGRGVGGRGHYYEGPESVPDELYFHFYCSFVYHTWLWPVCSAGLLSSCAAVPVLSL